MDVFDALFTRRSIRKYSGEDISMADEEIILKAAMSAPANSCALMRFLSRSVMIMLISLSTFIWQPPFKEPL